MKTEKEIQDRISALSQAQEYFDSHEVSAYIKALAWVLSGTGYKK